MRERKIKQIGQDSNPVIYLSAVLAAEFWNKEVTQCHRINHR